MLVLYVSADVNLDCACTAICITCENEAIDLRIVIDCILVVGDAVHYLFQHYTHPSFRKPMGGY